MSLFAGLRSTRAGRRRPGSLITKQSGRTGFPAVLPPVCL